MEQNQGLNELNSESEITLTKEEKETKILLSFAYLQAEIENNLANPNEKNFKSILKKLKQFESELEENLDSKVSLKEKKIFIELKSSKFDKDFIKISKYI